MVVEIPRWSNAKHEVYLSFNLKIDCKAELNPIKQDIKKGKPRFLTKTGDVIPMKVVGCIALIDEGETDWKIIAINTDDPRHEKSTVRWLKYYKVPAGSGPNKFAFE
ncbi:hypothetical protein MXB_3124, partial [Myxobolus squamalis]